jgi:hypothetical protein
VEPYLVFSILFSRSLFVLLFFFFWPLYWFTDSHFIFGIFKLFLENGECYGYISASVSMICLLGFVTVFTGFFFLQFIWTSNILPTVIQVLVQTSPNVSSRHCTWRRLLWHTVYQNLKKVGKNAVFAGFKISITSTSALVYFRVKIVSFNTKPIAKYSKIINAFKQSKYIIYKPWSTNEHK